MWKLEEERQDPEMHVARRYITWAGASGNYKGMKQLLEKALEIFEKHNEDHPETALTLICLSRAYQSLGDNATAKVTLSKAINILSFWSRAVLSLRFTMKEGPSVLRYIEEATFLGRFIDGAQLIYASYPGKFKDGWYILVKDDGEYSEESVACVYCCTREEGLGVHVPDPFDSTAPCYCRRIYGKGNHTNRNFEQCPGCAVYEFLFLFVCLLQNMFSGKAFLVGQWANVWNSEVRLLVPSRATVR